MSLACDTDRVDFSIFLCYTLQNVFSSTIESISIHAQDTGYSDRTLPRPESQTPASRQGICARVSPNYRTGP